MAKYISSLPDPGNSPAFPRKLIILGCTGSIGTSALQVVAQHQDRFRILGLAAGRNVALLAEQADRWRPPVLAVLTEELARSLKERLPAGYHPDILVGPGGYVEMASLAEADMVLSSQVGAAGLAPTLAAVQAGKWVALANKESLVLAGDLIRKECARTGAVLLPVDSEHNALFQCACGHEFKEIEFLHLTASGGPFRDKDFPYLSNVTPEQALAHPNWDMGAKISIDSSTLMNKGLEIIEAHHLFGTNPDRLRVVVHPESIVHSLVEYKDGSLLAHLGVPSMQIPLAYCLGFPERFELMLKPLDLASLGSLHFEEPDLDRFPCLGLALDALRAGMGAPVVLNAANEIAVELFLQKKIPYLHIPKIVQDALHTHVQQSLSSIEEILELDMAVRKQATEFTKLLK
ncbi:MAG: 1-deoxy-D-xylulose-5-phosphate reductoisomerase [Desulfovibrionales bacterium]